VPWLRAQAAVVTVVFRLASSRFDLDNRLCHRLVTVEKNSGSVGLYCFEIAG
jgi:hypothetical protein